MRPFSYGPAPVERVRDDEVPFLHPDVLFSVVDGRVVLYDRGLSRSHVLNPTAATVWAEVDDRRSVGQIVDALREATGADGALIDRDVKEVIDRLQRSGILSLTPAADAGDHDAAPAAHPEAGSAWAEPAPPDLDAVAWNAIHGPVRALDRDLTVRTNHPPTHQRLPAVLAALPASPETAAPAVLSLFDDGIDGPSRYRLYVDGRRRWSDGIDGHCLAAVHGEITELAIDHPANHVLFHGGAVERDGRVVVVAGESGRGKSTLTAALVRRGFGYLTDEVAAVVPHDLSVVPFPKALDLDGSAQHLLGLDASRYEGPGKQPVPVADIGRVSAGGRLALIVLLTDRVASLDAATDGTSPTIATLLELIGVTFVRTLEREDALDHLAHVAATVPVLRLRRAGLDDLCATVESALNGPLSD